MKAELLVDEHHVLDRRTIVEIVVWRLDRPVRGSTHRFKYRLALGARRRLNMCPALRQ
jgi:hypothetical protein